MSKIPRARTAPPTVVTHDVDEIYRRYSATVLRRALRFFPRSEAEEVVHEVFLKLLEEPSRFRGESSPATWLFTVTTRLCIDRARQNATRAALLSGVGETLWSRVDPGTSPEARAFLGALWRRLDPELVMLGVMYHHDGLTTAQIAELIGVSDRTVATRLGKLTEHATMLAEEEP